MGYAKKNVRAAVMCFGVFAMGVIGVRQAAAQSTAAILGTVVDASGAAMAEATIQVKNLGTGIMQVTTSDAQGRYRVPDLIIGEYEIQATKPGFQTSVRTGVRLTVGSDPVVDFSLPVGQAQQTITVEGAISQVETQSTAVSTLVESKQINDLPLNGRNFTQLMTLAPGVTQIPLGAPGAGSTFYGNGQKYSIAGSRPSGQAYLLDDQDMTNFWNNGPGAGGLGTALGVEAVAEFQTLTNTYSAQFGGNGAVINASTKSGTNGFHGSAFEFLRNDKLEARNFFDGASPPAFRQNQFGGSIGGPIKKNKLFFFVNYEGLRNYRAVSSQVTVPDQCAHKFLTSTVTPGVCGGPITQNANPAVAQAIANTMALWPNTAFNELLAGGAPSGTGNAFVIDPAIGNENYVVARVDYTLSDHSSILFRYVLDRAERDFTTGIPYWPETDTTRDHFVNIEERHILTPKLVNLVHAGFTRTFEAASVSGSPTVAGSAVSPGTIASAGTHPLQFFGTSAGREDGTIGSFSGVTAIGASTTLPFYLVPNKFSVGDDVIWTSGAHTIQAGGTITRLRENTWAPFVVGTTWSFSSLGTFEAGNPASVQGQVSDQQNPLADAYRDYRYIVYTPYVQDQWKATRKLTVNVGLRYSPTSLINETRHQQFQLLNPPYGVWTPESTSSQTNPSLRNWDPRVGLAYDPFSDHKTSIRASFGMFHNVIYSRDLNNWLAPPFITATQTSAQNLQYLGTCSASCTPFSVPITPGVIPTNGSLSLTNSNYWYVTNTPYQEQWNLTIQREVAPNTVATVGYIGSHNVHMFTQLDFNTPTPCLSATSGCYFAGVPTFASAAGVANARLNPQFNSLVLANTIASSHYEALQSSLTRRFSNGWQAQVSYTYSKSIDNSSGTYGLDGGGLGNSGTNPTNLSADTGVSNFSRKNNFRVSGIYVVPTHFNGVSGVLVNGWQITGIYSFLSGAPFSPLSAANRVFSGTGSPTGRPNVIAGCDLYTGFKTLAQWFNPGCFALQPVGTYGNAGRDTIIGPNLWDVDSSLVKDFRVSKISERFVVQFRAEAFNLFNHPSFQNPANTVFAGTAVNGSAGRITATNSNPRQIQLALKIAF